MTLSFPLGILFSTSLVYSSILLLIGLAVQRRYFSALAKIPGPFWASITRLWNVWYIVKGDHNLRLIDLHDKHGHFVRLSPDEVSVSHPDGPRIILQSLLRKVCSILPHVLRHSVDWILTQE